MGGSFREWFRIDRNLIFLKLAFFFIYSAWLSTWPYITLISTELASYEQLAILFAFIPVISIVVPIIVGFIADKTGSYKAIMTVALLVGVAANSSLLWLQTAVSTRSEVVELHSNISSEAHLSWNSSGLQLHTSIDLPHENATLRLELDSCYLFNESIACSVQMETLTVIGIRKSVSNRWEIEDGVPAEIFDSCRQFFCSVSIENATWISEITKTEVKSFVFPILLIVRILGFMSVDAVAPLLDATGLYMTKTHNGDFAQQKMWAMFSMVVAPLVCGALIDYIGDSQGFKSYDVAFAISGFLALVVVPFISKLDVDVVKNKESMLTTARTVGRMLDVNVFFLVQMVVGVCWGFHMNFLPVYLDTELKASKTLLGMSLSANGIGAMIILAIGTMIVNRLGQANTVALGLVLYGARFVTLYFLENPWVILFIESIDGFSNFLTYLAGSYFCAAAAPPGMLGSLSGILSAAVFGAGRGLGSTVGSALIPKVGIRTIYLAFGITAAASAALYLFAYHTVLKHYEERRLRAKDEKPNDGKVHCAENAAIDISDELPPAEHKAAELKEKKEKY